MNDGGWQSARQEVVAMLEGKVEELRSSIDEVRRLQAARAVAEESANKSKGKGKGAGTGQGTVVQVKNARGEEITSALQQLIDAAILRYSKDVIARPDYALFTAGARIVPAITSDTLVIQPKSSWARTLWGAKPAEGLPPAVALTPDGNVGKCWPFKGAEGQLGVMLSSRTVVGAVTVEHASRDVAMDVSSAPREIEVVSVSFDLA
jgi:SUN domain-containing protein 1/2